MNFRTLTNVRPKKDLGTQFVVSCVPGQLKLTPDAAKLLKVGAGNYVGVVTDTESESAFIFKGSDDGLGGKLAGKTTMSFSAAAAWNELKGDEEFNTYYNVSETPVDESELEGTMMEGKELYELTFDRKEEKVARKSSKSDSSDSSDDSDSGSEVEASADAFDEL